MIIVYIKGGQLVSVFGLMPDATIEQSTQVNIAAFDSDRSFVLGTKRLPPDQPTVVPSSTEELLATFKEFGDGVRALLSCATNINKWYINVLYPHLPTFVKGRVVLVGDAVSLMPR